MPYSREHKQRSRENILDSALKLFTQQGFEKTSIDEIMSDAKLTRGAFYAHFKNKSELYQQALLSGTLNSKVIHKKPEQYSDEQWFKIMIKAYLSTKHVRKAETPCPLAFLVTDVATSEPGVKQTYAEVYQKMNKLMVKYASRFSDCDSNKIYAVTAMMIGAVAIGRSIDNIAKLKMLLTSCETTILEILEIA